MNNLGIKKGDAVKIGTQTIDEKYGLVTIPVAEGIVKKLHPIDDDFHDVGRIDLTDGRTFWVMHDTIVLKLRKIVPGDNVKIVKTLVRWRYVIEVTIAEGVIKSLTSLTDDLGEIGDILLEDGRAFIGSASMHIVPV